MSTAPAKPCTTIFADADIREMVEVQVEISDLSDGELRGCLVEAKKRNMNTEDLVFEREYAEEAYRELLGGRDASALCLLERCLFGKRKITPEKAA